MKSRNHLIFVWPLTIAAAVACASLLFALLTRGENHALGKQLVYDIQHHIKKGDDFNTISKYLDNQDSKKVLGRGDLENISVMSDSRIPVQQLQQYVSKGAVSALRVLVPDVNRFLLSQTSLLITFFFDKDKKLVGHTIQDTGISL